jgi:hypothetical protein
LAFKKIFHLQIISVLMDVIGNLTRFDIYNSSVDYTVE